MDGGHGANQLRLPGPAHALALAAAAATGGASRWGLLALQAAQNPQVHEATRQVSIAGYNVVAEVATRMYDEDGLQWHVDWKFGAFAIALLVLCGFVAVLLWSCSFSALAGGAVGVILTRNLSQPVSSTAIPRGQADVAAQSALLDSLAAVANVIDTGGPQAVARVASELDVSEDAVRAWYVLWKQAIKCPRRS